MGWAPSMGGFSPERRLPFKYFGPLSARAYGAGLHADASLPRALRDSVFLAWVPAGAWGTPQAYIEAFPWP